MALLLSAVMLLLLFAVVRPVRAKAYSYLERGCDVSVYQGEIDWQLLAGNENMQFVIMRACTLGSAYGTFNADANFEKNYAGARAIGLKVGCYCFCGANSYEGIINTTKSYIETIKGKTFDLPVYIDVESDAMTVIPRDKLTTYLIEALDMIRDAGYTAGIYANLNWFRNFIDGERIREAGYELWLARYVSNRDEYDYSDTYDIWQHTDSGQYAGHDGYSLDLDIAYVNYALDGNYGKEFDESYAPFLPMKTFLREKESVQPFYVDKQTPIPNAIIDPPDECLIREVYTDGWCKVEYPSSSGTRVGYLPLSEFFTTPPSEFKALYSPTKVTTYSRADLEEAVGYVGHYDTLYVTIDNDDRMQVIYSVSSGKKIAWISKRDWDLAVLKLVDDVVHCEEPLRVEQLPVIDLNEDGLVDVFDLALIKRRLDGVDSAVV